MKQVSKKITADELMELFIDTLRCCGTQVLRMSNEDIEYNIFEKSDIGVISFLHSNSLLRLKKAGLISEEILKKSSDLRNKFIELEGTDQWSVDSVKSSKKWKEILELSDQIMILVDKWQKGK